MEIKDRGSIVTGASMGIGRATEFEKNALKGGGRPAGAEGETRPRQPADTAECIAGKIVDAIKTGEAEVYTRDWMKR